jgi:hypothetical protein
MTFYRTLQYNTTLTMASTTAAAAAAVAPPGVPGPMYVDTQHEDLVHDAQMDYYGSKLATCSSGKQKRTMNNECMHLIPLHSNPI